MTFAVLGLDPGFASLGYAVVELGPQPRCVRFGVFVTQKTAKKRNVLSVDDNLRRACAIAHCLRGLATTNGLRTVAIAAESMSFPRSASVAAKVAMAWGCIASLSEAANLPVLQASPQQVKAAVCGCKTASKDEVQAAVLGLYPEVAGLRAGIAKGALEHPSDALAVAHLMLQSDVVRMMRLTG